jgi:hypothetical protein
MGGIITVAIWKAADARGATTDSTRRQSNGQQSIGSTTKRRTGRSVRRALDEVVVAGAGLVSFARGSGAAADASVSSNPMLTIPASNGVSGS